MLRKIVNQSNVRKSFLNINSKNVYITTNIGIKKFSSLNKCLCNPTYLSNVHISYKLRQYSQERLYSSSNISENTLHKVLFVNAESPQNNENKNSEELLYTDNQQLEYSENVVNADLTYIPPPPVPPEVLDPPLTALGEPTLSSLGLAGVSPVGLVQSFIETLHVTLDIPWWGAIALATCIIRFTLSPFVIMTQRNAAKMSQVMPKIQEYQQKLTEARTSGNNLEAARIAYELQLFMKGQDIRPLRNALLPLLQAPIFISMFIGLRRCATLPVESFQTGGALWFTDLTVADPYFLLPVITSLTLLATIEIGTDGKPMGGPNAKLIKYFLRGLPFVVFPLIINFPSAVLCYWASTNVFSLCQVAMLRIPRIRTYFKIDPFVKHESTSKADKKGFIANVKESYSNMKVAGQVRDRYKFDEMQFKKAGMGPLVKTYKHNPLEKKPVINVKAKQND